LEDNEEPPNYKSNPIPKGVLTLENIFELQDRFRPQPNVKTHSSILNHEFINISTEDKPKPINLGIACTLEEKQAFTRLFKKYQDVFVWRYEDLKMYDTKIIQHMIPMKDERKHFQHNLRTSHPSLEPHIHKEIKKNWMIRLFLK